MAEPVNDQGHEHIPVDPPERDIQMDVQRSREEVRTAAEWLVLFRRARGDVYEGQYDPIGLDAWVVQMELILEAMHTPQQYWVVFSTIQLGRLAAIWWRDLGADPRTTSWSSFIGALREEFGAPPVPPSPVMHLEVDSEEEEDPSEDPMDDGEPSEAEPEPAPVPEPVQPVPRGARPIVISTHPRIIRTAVVPRGRPRGDGASSSRLLPMTSEDRSAIRE